MENIIIYYTGIKALPLHKHTVDEFLDIMFEILDDESTKNFTLNQWIKYSGAAVINYCKKDKKHLCYVCNCGNNYYCNVCDN